MIDQTKTATMAQDLSKFTRAKYKKLLDKLKNILEKEKPVTIAQIDSLFPKLGAEIDPTEPSLKKIYDHFMKKVYKKGMITGANSVKDVLKQDVKLPFNQPHARALSEVKKISFLNIKNINDEIKVDLRKGLYDAIQSGEGVKGLTNRVEAVLKKKPKKASKNVQADARSTPEYRAELIARTELVRAYNRGNLENIKMAGIEKKQWVTGHDERVCPICAPMNGQVKNVNEPFVGKLPNGKIIKVMTPPIHCQCRCVIIAKL